MQNISSVRAMSNFSYSLKVSNLDAIYKANMKKKQINTEKEDFPFRKSSPISQEKPSQPSSTPSQPFPSSSSPKAPSS